METPVRYWSKLRSGHSHVLIVLRPQIRWRSFAYLVDLRRAGGGAERLGRVDDHGCARQNAGAAALRSSDRLNDY